MIKGLWGKELSAIQGQLEVVLATKGKMSETNFRKNNFLCIQSLYQSFRH
ncbi:hypothetical protein SynPROSU1_01871 [Synechococcus sp. PROS-U-1]|nr:hypothetical protein SynPROSU1_01871 [Synechococcus sp. PROS-U-1]